MRILVVNAGSSSLKLAVIGQPGDEVLAQAELDRGADATRHSADDLAEALDQLQAGDAEAVGYRVVHGGARHDPSLVSDAVLDEIEALDALAPLHNRVAAAAIRDLRHRLPDVPHVACFDTAFHATLPVATRTYALPAEWVERHGLRRYGFHGLSVSWATDRTAELLGLPAGDLQLVVAHLGSGASVTAVRAGRSVATTMGMTPLEGLVMGTRSGSVDPGILLHLLRSGTSPEALAEGLTHEGGLLALSGGTAGMQELEAATAAGDERARLAIDVFAASAAAHVAGVATALERLDAVAFTGGIGFRSRLARAAITARLAVLGVPPLAPEGPTADSDTVLAIGPPAVVAVLAREDLVIARQVAEVVTNRPT